MRVLVTGASGQLGHDVCKRLEELRLPYWGVSSRECDLRDPWRIERVMNAYAPDCVAHCAAYTDVDRAEREPALCMAVNAEGTRRVALACKRLGAKLLYVSTDYVFSGAGTSPWETNAPAEPLNVYGQSKLLGEKAVIDLVEKRFVLRTSWVFGSAGNNFVQTMLRLGQERRSVSVVLNQIGSPTYARDLAVLICDMLHTEQYGVYHATNEGYCSRSEFARAIMQKAGLACRVLPVTTLGGEACAAKRPLNARLSKRCLEERGFHRLPPWDDALARYLWELNGQGEGL